VSLWVNGEFLLLFVSVFIAAIVDP
jgi:hypothetical protein